MSQTIASPDRYRHYRALAEKLNLDAIALVPGSNFRRTFGGDFHQNERPLVVVIPRTGAPAAVVPNLELGSFSLLNFEGEVFDWRDQTGYRSAFQGLASHLRIKRIGVEGQNMRVFVYKALAQAYPNAEILDHEKEISELRICKNAEEIALLEKAIAISQEALRLTLENTKVGQTEAEVEKTLSQALFGCGAEEFSFTPIVAAGENSARPHAKAREDYKIQAGETLLIDFGARYGGLCADITRTVFVGGCSDFQREIYAIVQKANDVGMQTAKPGVSAHQVDDAVTSVLEASPYADYIKTKTGHGLGRDVHEEPYIMRGNDRLLEPGMVFTIEPGLYKDGAFGVRIEDDVLVTDSGVRSLTTFSRDLMILDA